jgi:methyltransferase (TIGR00027 family)
MLKQPVLISLRVSDLDKAKQWYAGVLGQAPVFEAPFAVAFAAGTGTLLLLPIESTEQTDERSVPFFEVDDIEASYHRLVGAGAAARSEITFTMLRSRMAKVVDPFGNVVGIMSAAETAKPVDSRPSESAMTVAFSRALAAHDDRERMRGPDQLAEVFLNEEGKKVLGDRIGREWILRKMAGTHEYFLARTRHLDDIVERALREEVPQIVFLGAGYDSRPYRFAELIKGSRIFELDVEPTQRRKLLLLERAGVSVPAQLVYVTIDFEQEAIEDGLVRAGFERDRKTVFLWEGVTYYLTPEAVDQTLRAVRSLAAPGSALCFDYMVQAPDLSSRYGVREVLDAWRTAYSGELVRFGIDEGTIGQFLATRGFRLIERLDPAEMEKRYLARADGTLAGRVVALFELIRAEVAG